MKDNHTIGIHHGIVPLTVETEWNAFLNEKGEGNFFQSPWLLALYRDLRNYSTQVVTVHNLQEKLCGVLVAVHIKERIKGIPFPRIIVQGGPILDGAPGERSIILHSLLSALINDIPEDTVMIEIRNHRLWGEEKDIFVKHGFIWHDHLNGILPVASHHDLMNGITPTRKRQIWGGLGNGAVITPARNPGEVKELYEILVQLYTEKIKKPLPPLSFFESFFHVIQHNKRGVILLVKYRGTVIAGIVCPFSPGETLHEWYITSARKEFSHLYPGVLATWAGIDYAVKNGFRRFDFMGMGTPHEPYGVRDFKKRFGGEVINFGRWRYVNNKTLYNLSLIGYKVMKRFAK